jgi:hypothetical protein
MFLLFADAVLALHLLFMAFVCVGALLALKWRWIPWLQLPAAAWGCYVEASGATCPLTAIENDFRLRAGRAVYEGDCIGHYLTAVIYPDGLTRTIQFALGAAVVVLNLSLYLWLSRRRRR